MARRRRQRLQSRGLGLILGVLTGMALPAACGSPEVQQLEPLRLHEAGAFDVVQAEDVTTAEAAAGAPDAAPDAEPTDAGLAPVELGVTPIVPGAGADIDAEPDAASTSDQTLAELSVLAAGARARALVVPLADLLDETLAPNDSAFANLGQTAALYRARGGSVLFTIALVDHAQDARPSALQASWSAAALRSTLQALIDRSFDTFGTELAYLSFGTDVDRFLSQANTSDRSACTALIEQALSYAEAHPKRPPATQIGVTFSAPGLVGALLPETQALLRQSAAAVVTNFPLDASFQALSVSNATAQLQAVADAVGQAAPGLPLVVQELGYPSATLVGSSLDAQQQFFQAAFSLLSARRDRFPFVNLYASADPDEAECEREAVTYGAAGDPFLIAARCSLGLKDASGVDKPAWAAVLAGLSTFQKP